MAKGYPDFFGYSMFPYYGTIYVTGTSTAVAAGATFTAISLTMKGYIHGGFLQIEGFDDLTTVFIRVYIDGNMLASRYLSTLIGKYSAPIPDQIMAARRISLEAKEAMIGIQSSLTFRDSFLITVRNDNAANALTVIPRVQYSNILT